MEKKDKKKLPFNVLKKGIIAGLLGVTMGLGCLGLAGCADGKNGVDGKDGTQWYSGTETPTSQGVDGDFYIDTDDFILYQKTNGQWTPIMYNFGKKGDDADAPTISINTEGYWCVDGTSTGIKAKGEDGTPGTTPKVEIKDGYWYINDVKSVKAEATDGHTPVITINGEGYWTIDGVPTLTKATPSTISIVGGYWYIDGATTNVKAEGKDGATWLSGTTEPTTEGKNGDFYLNESNYDIYKKTDGAWSKIGNIKGTDGETPYISNGYWWIGNTNTGIEAGSTSYITMSSNGELIINGKIVDADTDVTYENLKLILDGFTITKEVSPSGKWAEGGSYTFAEAGYINSQGAVTNTSSTWVHTDFIPVSRLNGNIGAFMGHGSVYSIAFYSSDSFDSYISGVKSSDMITEFGKGNWISITSSYVQSKAPSDAEYVVFSTDSNKSGSTNNLTVDISPSTETQLVYKITANENASSTAPEISSKLMHFSFDDTIASLKDLTENKDTYTSLFDSPFFGALKEVHDEYGATFSCYCFYNQTQKVESTTDEGESQISYNVTFSLSDCTDKFADEFSENSSWLRFGFHSKSNETYYSKASGITAEEATIDYEDTISELIRITGSAKCIDTCIRLQSFTGTEEICKAFRDASICGVTGFLTADYSEIITQSNTTENIDTSTGYYLTAEEAKLCGKKGRYFDYENQLFFFASNKRLDNTTSANVAEYMEQFNTAERYNRSHIMEMYAHENQMIKNISDYKLRLKNAAEWASNNGYTFGFSMDKINQML